MVSISAGAFGLRGEVKAQRYIIQISSFQIVIGRTIKESLWLEQYNRI